MKGCGDSIFPILSNIPSMPPRWMDVFTAATEIVPLIKAL